MRSLNFSQGLNSAIAKLNWILSLKKDIYFISELKMSNYLRSQAIETYLKTSKYGNFNFFYNSTSNSRGVGILYSNLLDINIHKITKDPTENFILLDVSINSFRLTLGSVYLPSGKDDTHVLNLTKEIDALDNYYKIVGGDFNFTPCHLPANLNIDLHNHKGCNPIASRRLQEWMKQSNLVEPFRSHHPQTRDFSFKIGKGSTASKSRIDFFFMNVEFLKILGKVGYEITPQPQFDHAATFLNFHKLIKHPYRIFISEWIADNDECLRLAKVTLINLINIYWVGMENEHIRSLIIKLNELNASIVSIRKYLSFDFDAMLTEVLLHHVKTFNDLYLDLNMTALLDPWPLSIAPSLALEIALNEIKMTASDFEKQNSLAKRREKEKLISRLNMAKNDPDYNSDLVKELENSLKTLLDDSKGILTPNVQLELKEMSSGNISVVSRSLNKKAQKNLNEVRDSLGNTFRNEEERSDYIVQFLTINTLLMTLCALEYNEGLYTNLTSDMTFPELTEVINSLNGGSAPGCDKVPATLLKKIAPAVIPLMLLAYNFVLKGLGDFSQSAKTAKVKLIPKNNHCHEIKNWRPISLTNNIFKIYSEVLAKRLAALLPTLLSLSQKAYLKSPIIS